MTDEQATRLEEKLDRILPLVEALGSVLIRQHVATDRAGLNKNTIPTNEKIQKFEGVAERKTYIEIGDLVVVRKSPKKRKHSK